MKTECTERLISHPSRRCEIQDTGYSQFKYGLLLTCAEAAAEIRFGGNDCTINPMSAREVEKAVFIDKLLV